MTYITSSVILPSEEDVEVRRKIAADPNTSARVLSEFANDEDIWVRVCVAKNPNTPAEVLEHLKREGKMAHYVIEFMHDCDYLYGRHEEWKDYVCGNFDENVVLTGNNHMYEVEEASWWKQAKHISEELGENPDDIEEFIADYNRYYGGVPEEKLREVFQEMESYDGYIDDTDFLVIIADKIHPELNLQQATLHGSMQSDWQDAIYNANVVDINTLNDFYMGNVMEMRLYELGPGDFDDYEDIEDIDLWDIVMGKDCIECPTITETEYYDLYREGFDKSLARYFGIPEGSFEILDD